MEEKENEKATKLLAIRNASGIKGRIEEQKALKDAAKENILSEEAKDSSSGKTNKEKIEEYKDKYKYNAFDVMLIIPALVKYFLNKNKSDKLKILNEDIKKQVEEQINTTAKAFYGNDKDMDEARRQEISAKMKNNVNELVGKIIEKNNDLAENMEKSGLMLDESGLKKTLIAQIQEVVNNDQSLKGYFQVPGQHVQMINTTAQNAQVSGQTKPNANALVEDRRKSIVLGTDAGDIAIKNAINGKSMTSVQLDENGKNRLESLNIKVGDCFDIKNGNSVIPAKRTVGGVQLF